MPSQITNYQCPTCTGPLHFAGDSGKLECDYCGGRFEVADIEALYADKDRAAQEAKAEADEKARERQAAAEEFDGAETGADWGDEPDGMRAYSCPSCGAELICDETTAATSCPYCGNPSIVPGNLAGTLKPDLVIPFKLDKEAAMAALREHYRGKALLPKSFKTTNHIEEIKGVYVPFWLYDGVAEADMVFDATRSHVHRRGDYQITVTDHFKCRRAGSVSYERIPVDASTKMPDDFMDSIEPFDYDELKPFSTAYMPGYLADKYDVSAREAEKRADDRAAQCVVDTLSDTVTGYQTCTVASRNVRLRRGKVSYAMLPVWMLNTKWNGKNYLFAMNGQTGRLVGDLPVSPGRLAAWFFGIFVPLCAAMTAWLWLA